MQNTKKLYKTYILELAKRMISAIRKQNFSFPFPLSENYHFLLSDIETIYHFKTQATKQTFYIFTSSIYWYSNTKIALRKKWSFQLNIEWLWANPKKTIDILLFTKEILNKTLHFIAVKLLDNLVNHRRASIYLKILRNYSFLNHNSNQRLI